MPDLNSASRNNAMRLPEEDLVAIPRYAAYVREKGEARTPGLTPNLSPVPLGGTCDGREIHHTTYLRATSPKTTLESADAWSRLAGPKPTDKTHFFAHKIPSGLNAATSSRSATTVWNGSTELGDSLMRDIRSDLEERAQIIQEQLRGTNAHFEKVMQQLQNERDARVADLKGTLAMIDKLMQFETSAMDKVVTLEHPPASQPSLADRMRG